MFLFLEKSAPGLGGGLADLRDMLRFGPSWDPGAQRGGRTGLHQWSTRSGDEAVVPGNDRRSPVISHLCVVGAPDGMDPSSYRGVRGQPHLGQRWKAG